jgi:hypothetical protein
MDIYAAIDQMRKLSERGKPFSVQFMSYSADRGKSSGIVVVERCVLRKQSTEAQNKYADIMLNYFDIDTKEYGQMYQPLLMEFNGVQLELK